MHPDVGRDLARCGQLDHVHRRRVAAFLARSTFQRRFQLPDRRIARSAYRIQRKACAGLAAIAFDLEPAEAAIEALTNCRRWLGRPAVTLHTDRPCFGLGAIRFADGFNCFFSGSLDADFGAAERLPKITSRDLVLMAGITATLASAGNATRIRCPGTATHPTGSDKCATSIQLPRTKPRSSHSSG